MDLPLFFTLPLIGGFAFVTGFFLLRWRSARQDAQRLYYLVELVRSDDKRMSDLISHLRETAPASPWLQEGLLAVANQHLLQKDYGASARFFEELASRFSSGRYASFANWKAAWLQLRQGDVVFVYPKQQQTFRMPGPSSV